MAVGYAFPGPGDVVDSVQLRKDLAALCFRNPDGSVRPGVLPRRGDSNAGYVVAQATMDVQVLPFNAILVRGDGPLFVNNDGAVLVPIAAAPATNSRIDVVYVMQHEDGYGGFADGDNEPFLGVAEGLAAISPLVPEIPAGALKLAQVTVPAGALSTNAAGVVVAAAHQWTALAGGTIWVKDVYERNNLTNFIPDGDKVYLRDIERPNLRVPGGSWAAGGSFTQRRQNTDFTMTATEKNLTFDATASEPTPSDWSYASSGVFTCLRAGWYLMNVAVAVRTASADRGYTMWLRVNGSATALARVYGLASGSAQLSSFMQYNRYWSIGDTLELRVSAGGGNVVTAAFAGNNYIQLQSQALL